MCSGLGYRLRCWTLRKSAHQVGNLGLHGLQPPPLTRGLFAGRAGLLASIVALCLSFCQELGCAVRFVGMGFGLSLGLGLHLHQLGADGFGSHMGLGNFIACAGQVCPHLVGFLLIADALGGVLLRCGFPCLFRSDQSLAHLGQFDGLRLQGALGVGQIFLELLACCLGFVQFGFKVVHSFGGVGQLAL